MSQNTFICSQCGSKSYEQFSRTQVRCLDCGTVNEFDTGYTPKAPFQYTKYTEVLDAEFNQKELNIPASLAKRFINFTLDLFFVCLLFTFIAEKEIFYDIKGEVVTLNNMGIFALFGLYMFYYVLLEYKFGKTIGKYFTKTKVISTTNSELSFMQCILRFLCRYIPFEFLSGLFGNKTFWHDSIPNTLVIEE